MADDLRIVGVEKMSAVTAALKAAPKELRRSVYASLGRAAKPLGELARDEARSVLPSGLGGEIADSMKIRAVVRFSANPRVTLKATATSAATSAFRKQKTRHIRKLRKRQKAWRAANGG